MTTGGVSSPRSRRSLGQDACRARPGKPRWRRTPRSGGRRRNPGRGVALPHVVVRRGDLHGVAARRGTEHGVAHEWVVADARFDPPQRRRADRRAAALGRPRRTGRRRRRRARVGGRPRPRRAAAPTRPGSTYHSTTTGEGVGRFDVRDRARQEITGLRVVDTGRRGSRRRRTLATRRAAPPRHDEVGDGDAEVERGGPNAT